VRSWILVLVGVAVSAGALFVVLRSVDLEETGRLVASANLPILSLTLVVVAVQIVLRTARWGVLLRPFAPRRLHLWRLAPLLLIGYLGNAVLPARLGEPIRAVLVNRREGVPLPEALGAVFLERLVDVATLGLVAFAAAAVAGAPAWVVQIAAIAALVGTGLVVLFAVGSPSAVVGAARRLPVARRRDAYGRSLDRVARFVGALGHAHPVSSIGIAVAVSSVAWVLDATTFWLVGRSLGIDLHFGAAVLVAAVAVLGTAIPSAPGYVGTFELAAASVAVALGVPESAALGLALVAHGATVLPPAVGGALSLVGTGASLRQVATEAAHTR